MINENWCNLPRFSHDITDALISLHNQEIYLDGNINPRTVLVQQRGNNTIPKVILPERYNIFNNECQEYNIKGVEALDERKRDLFSFCLLIYFIQTCGHNFSDQNYGSVLICPENFERKLEKEERCLAAKSSSESRKYRMWKNSLAGHLIAYVLKHLDEISTSKLLRHPFYWNNWQIVNFISKAASYVKEGTPQPSVRKELENEAIDFTAEMISYEKIKQYMKSRFPLTRSKSNPIDLENYFELLKGIRNKVRVCIFN